MEQETEEENEDGSGGFLHGRCLGWWFTVAVRHPAGRTLAKAEKIFVIPGAISSGAGRFKHCVRISCGAPWNEQMEDGIRRLGRLAAMLQAR